MTIKQQGGIFGRNPTFNDVEANSASVTANGTNAVTVKRTSSDGNLMEFYRDTTLAGLIGVASSDLLIGRVDGEECFIRFGFGGDTISPSTGSGAANNGNVSLGVNSSRWKDIYLTGDINTSGGNLVVASGKGIDFSATSGTGTSELFDDYEEGTWTPTLTSGPTLSAAVGRYTKVGNVVYVMAKITRNDAAANSNAFELGGLPYTPDNSNPTSANGLGVAASYNGSSDRRVGIINSSNGNTVFIVKTGTAVNVTYDNFIADTRTAELKWFYYT